MIRFKKRQSLEHSALQPRLANHQLPALAALQKRSRRLGTIAKGFLLGL